MNANSEVVDKSTDQFYLKLDKIYDFYDQNECILLYINNLI